MFRNTPALLPPCIIVRVPLCAPFHAHFDLWARIVLNRCGEVVACLASIAITFAGRNWKNIEYPCPTTRWYYETKVGELILYCGYHTFLAALYLLAHGVSGSAVMLAVCAPFALLRFWACMGCELHGVQDTHGSRRTTSLGKGFART